MITVRDLKLMNEAMIKYLESKEANNKRNIIIDNILDDETCFFKINKEKAIEILADIGVGESKLEKIYSELISKEEYERLRNNNILDENDKELKIKY